MSISTVALVPLLLTLLSAATAEHHLQPRLNAANVTLNTESHVNVHVRYKIKFGGITLTLCPDVPDTTDCGALSFQGAARDGSLDYDVCDSCNENGMCILCDSLKPDLTDRFRDGEIVLSLLRHKADLVVSLYNVDFGKSQVVRLPADTSRTVLRVLPYLQTDATEVMEVKFSSSSAITDVKCSFWVVREFITAVLAAPKICWADTPGSVHFVVDFSRCIVKTIQAAFKLASDLAEFCG